MRHYTIEKQGGILLARDRDNFTHMAISEDLIDDLIDALTEYQKNTNIKLTDAKDDA